MKGTYYNATGRRKNAIARVWLAPGSGTISVNEQNLLDYFKRDTLKMIIEQPLQVTDTLGKYDIKAHVIGGGLTGQAGALLLVLPVPWLKPMKTFAPCCARVDSSPATRVWSNVRNMASPVHASVFSFQNVNRNLSHTSFFEHGVPFGVISLDWRMVA